jgi:hypothetical protein
MPRSPLTPLKALACGAVAGALGTAAMDALLYRRYTAGGGADGFLDWETAAGVETYDGAPAPAQVGRRLVEGYLQTALPPASARPMTNAMHWATGVGWGVNHGLVVGSLPHRRSAYGLATGMAAWSASYATLAPAGLYEPIWRYPADVLLKDASAHALYGLVTGTAFRLLAGGRARP